MWFRLVDYGMMALGGIEGLIVSGTKLPMAIDCANSFEAGINEEEAPIPNKACYYAGAALNDLGISVAQADEGAAQNIPAKKHDGPQVPIAK